MRQDLRRRLDRAAQRLAPEDDAATCPACAVRPKELPLLFRQEGRITDGKGNDIDPAWLEPCPRCGRGGIDELPGVRIVSGIDPSAI
jgi:hypothetical protein